MTNFCVICDFDGTITLKDVSEAILTKNAIGDWKAVEILADQGETSMEECISKQYGMLKGPIDLWFQIADAIPPRPGFNRFLQWIELEKIPFTCISAGLLPVIEYYKKKYRWNFPVIAPKIKINSNGVTATPVPIPKGYNDFKEYHVKLLKKTGKKVVYIGDGGSDINGIVHADLRFAIQNSPLQTFLNKNKVEYTAFSNFDQIVKELKSIEPNQ